MSDSSISNATGTRGGGNRCTYGRVDNAGLFDKTDYVSIPDRSSFHFTTAMSVTAWVKPASLGGSPVPTILNKSTGLDSYVLGTNSSGFFFGVPFLRNGSIVLTSVSAAGTVDEWTHLVGVYDGANVKLYKNGVLAASTPASGSMTLNDPSQAVTIGRYFSGRLDDVRLYGVALPTSVIGSLSCVAGGCGLPPADGMIKVNTALLPGTYSLSNGLTIANAGVTLDCNGAKLVGSSFQNYGVSATGQGNVTIKNCTITNYFYGIKAESGDGIVVEHNELSDNYEDPGAAVRSVNIVAPWNPNDRVNLGGGLVMRLSSGSRISRNVSHSGENGIDLYDVSNSVISDNDTSVNVGWGIHLNHSTGNTITRNKADYCNRGAGGLESAGMLLVQGSNGNTITSNSFQHSGDGFFIGNENGTPSNGNWVQGNDGSYATDNAFEATFSTGNCFVSNEANYSDYGFWLGYSHDGTIVDGNWIVENRTAGIEIEHGQRNTITNNYIEATTNDSCARQGIVLRTDGQAHHTGLGLPADQAKSTTYTVTGNIIRTKGWGLRFQQMDGERICNTDGGRVVTCPAMGTCTSQILNNEVTNTGSNPTVGTATCDANLNIVSSSVNLQVNTVVSQGAGNTWSTTPGSEMSVLGGPKRGGNFWSNYTGLDNGAGGRPAGDGLGDTNLPYLNVNPTGFAQLVSPGDPNPLVKR